MLGHIAVQQTRNHWLVLTAEAVVAAAVAEAVSCLQKTVVS